MENRIFLWIIELTSEVSPTIFPSSSHSFPQIMGLTWDLLGTYLGSPHKATNRHPEGIPKASRRKYVSFIDQIPTEHLSNIGRWKESGECCSKILPNLRHEGFHLFSSSSSISFRRLASAISWKFFFFSSKLVPRYFSFTTGLTANSSGLPWKRMRPSKSR